SSVAKKSATSNVCSDFMAGALTSFGYVTRTNNASPAGGFGHNAPRGSGRLRRPNQMKTNPTMHDISVWTALLFGAAAFLFAGCATMPGSSHGVVETSFGEVDGKPAKLFTLRNDKGAEAKISNYGGIVTSLKVRDRNTKLGDVVLGYDSLNGYLKSTPYFGCLVGRYGNRIAKGKFTLNGKEYTLAVNNGANSLHGGK